MSFLETVSLAQRSRTRIGERRKLAQRTSLGGRIPIEPLSLLSNHKLLTLLL